MSVRQVTFYFDFISPYAYLALAQARAFAQTHQVHWRLRPVVYAKLLDATGLVGPGETPAKRRYTFLDAVRTAQFLRIPFSGPPAHPFRSIDALRVVCLYLDHPRALCLCERLARACWAEERDISHWAVLQDLVEEVDLNAEDLELRCSSPEIKQRLRHLTEEALQQGVFGVPSFLLQDDLYWGQDRLSHLAAALKGEWTDSKSLADRILERPQLVRRKKAPRPS